MAVLCYCTTAGAERLAVQPIPEQGCQALYVFHKNRLVDRLRVYAELKNMASVSCACKRVGFPAAQALPSDHRTAQCATNASHTTNAGTAQRAHVTEHRICTAAKNPKHQMKGCQRKVRKTGMHSSGFRV